MKNKIEQDRGNPVLFLFLILKINIQKALTLYTQNVNIIIVKDNNKYKGCETK